MIRFLIALVFLAMLALRAEACSCGTCKSYGESGVVTPIFQHIAEAEILFSTDLPPSTAEDPLERLLAPVRQLIVRPTKVYRGPPRDWLVVNVSPCAIGGEPGSMVQIAAIREDDGQLHASACTWICAEDLGLTLENELGLSMD